MKAVFQRGSDGPHQVLLRKRDEDGEWAQHHGVYSDLGKRGSRKQQGRAPAKSGYRKNESGNGNRKYKHTLKDFVIKEKRNEAAARDEPGVRGGVCKMREVTGWYVAC